jgi:hypothetical protein
MTHPNSYRTAFALSVALFSLVAVLPARAQYGPPQDAPQYSDQQAAADDPPDRVRTSRSAWASAAHREQG